MSVELEKPPYGSPCNGCGICCQNEVCPLGQIAFPSAQAPCPALERNDERYVCGLIAREIAPFFFSGVRRTLPRMDAVAPQIPDTREIVFAKDQPEYIPLPAALVERPEGTAVITRWQFTEEERSAIANGADLYLELLTFGGPLQPIRMHVGDEPSADA